MRGQGPYDSPSPCPVDEPEVEPEPPKPRKRWQPAAVAATLWLGMLASAALSGYFYLLLFVPWVPGQVSDGLLMAGDLAKVATVFLLIVGAIFGTGLALEQVKSNWRWRR